MRVSPREAPDQGADARFMVGPMAAPPIRRMDVAPTMGAAYLAPPMREGVARGP